MAATVPYQPVPEVSISQQGIQGVNVPTPIAAFGGTIAEAIGTAGRTIERAGDEIMQRALALKQLENETEATEADANYTEEMGLLRAQYHSLEGKNAVAAYPKFVSDVKALQQRYSGSLSNPTSKRIFDRQSRSMMARTIFNGAGHSASQNRRWAEGAATARVDNNINDTLHDGSPTAIQAGRQSIEDESHTIAGLNGWDDAQRQAWVRGKNSQLLVTRLRGMARTDPFEAAKFLEENRAQLDTRDIDRAEQIVRTNLFQVGSRRISEEVNSQPIEGGENLETRIERGIARAKELVPDNEDFVGFVRDKIITDYNRQNSIRRDLNLQRRQVIESALMGQTGDGKLPTTIEELKAMSPEVGEAWDSLPASTQRSYLRAMAQNAKGEIAWTDEGLRRYQQLKGMAATDPVAFLNADVVSERFPSSARRELVNLQVRLKQRPEADPRVTRALQTLRPMLRSAGIMPDQDKDRYQQFVGALQDQLQEFQKERNKFPTQEEVQKIGVNLIGNQRDPTKFTFGGLITRQTPLFEMTLPDQLLEQFRNDPRWQGRTPSDAEVELFRRQYIRKRYQELFGGSASGGQAANPVPTVPISK